MNTGQSDWLVDSVFQVCIFMHIPVFVLSTTAEMMKFLKL